MELVCSIDWPALGTWAAVIVALWLGLRDSAHTRRREKAEARALARLVASEIDRLGVAANELKKRLEDFRKPAKLEELLSRGAERILATECAEIAPRLKSSASEILLGRTHVLRPEVSDAIMESLASFSLAHTLCEAVVAQRSTWTPKQAVMHTEGLISCAEQCIANGKSAAKACKDQIEL